MLGRQSRPRMRARPPLGRRNPRRVRINVDLPAPLGPSNPTAFPVPETPRRQVIPWRISRRPSVTFRFSNSTTGIAFKNSPPRSPPPQNPVEGRARDSVSLLSLNRPAQALDEHQVHDQSRDTSTASRMDLFRRSIEHDKNRIAPG